MQRSQISIELQSIAVWAPTLDTPKQWRDWAFSGLEIPVPITQGMLPPVSFLPPALRRRCSDLAKASLAVAYTCQQHSAQMPKTIFASRHGEAVITLRLIEALAQKELLSPTDFSLSIHNGTSGLFSIAAKNTEASTAIAGTDSTLLAGLLETVMTVNANNDSALLIVSDETVPSPFTLSASSLTPLPVHACGLLCRSASSSGKYILDMSFPIEAKKEISDTVNFDFIRWLLAGSEPFEIPTHQNAWAITKRTPSLDYSECLLPLHGTT